MEDEVKQEVQEVDKLATFEEMKENMEQTINNLGVILEQQGDLVKIVMENDKDKKFEEFINEMNHKISDIANQREVLKIRVEKINSLLLLARNDEKFKKVLLDIFDIFGIFR